LTMKLSWRQILTCSLLSCRPPWSFATRIEPLLEDVPQTTRIILICLSAHRYVFHLFEMSTCSCDLHKCDLRKFTSSGARQLSNSQMGISETPVLFFENLVAL
jgi:hypothetical protein